MAQVSDMMFTFQLGKTLNNTFTPNRSLESIKPKQSNFKDDLTAARNADRKDDRYDDYKSQDSRPLQKTPGHTERVDRAERKLNKKVDQKPEDEKGEKKPVKKAKKVEDDLNELLELLNNLQNAQPTSEAKDQKVSTETLEAVKELADAVKSQGLNLTGDAQKDIGKLVDMLKEIAGKSDETAGMPVGTADMNQQVKDLVDKIIQSQQGQKSDSKGDTKAAVTSDSIQVEKAAVKEQNPAIQTLYKMNKLNYELKNLSKAEGQPQNSELNRKAEAAAVPGEAKTQSENDVKQTAAEAAAETAQTAVKPEEKAASDSVKQTQVKAGADVSEEKLQKAEDKKDAAKVAREEKLEVKTEEKQEIKKAPGIEKTDNKKVTLDSKEQNNNIYKNDMIQNDKPFEKVMASVRTERTTNVAKPDVINQIIKKAEVAIGDKQSEMRMQLEPENLGKLTLKVAVERGLVTAKFVAESQQVKEIIESNFNQLKDALSEKGINVQSFSVSVGQDNNSSGSGAENYKQMWQDSIRTSSRSSFNEGSFVETPNDYASRPANPYSYHDGKVDYRA